MGTVTDIRLSDIHALRDMAHSAAETRALATHPDVVALRVEQVRSQVDALMWTGLLLGLAFTMVNVQTFAAAGAAPWSLAWCAAWLLDPMVSLVLVAVLRAEQVTARWQVPPTGPWVRRTKAATFIATYTMNTWQSWAELHAAGIVLHSVPPVLVYLVAETTPILRDRLTEAVTRAAVAAAQEPPSQDRGSDLATFSAPDVEPVRVPAQEESTRKPARRRSKRTARTSRAEYLQRARAAYRPGVTVTPAWVRSAVPEISRGSSQTVSDALKAELAARSRPTVDDRTEVAA